MLEALNQLEATGLSELATASDAAAVEAWRLAYLGNSGKLKAMMGGLKDVPKDQKPAVGARLNTAKQKLEEALAAKKATVGSAAGSCNCTNITSSVLRVSVCTRAGILRIWMSVAKRTSRTSIFRSVPGRA